MHAVWNVMYCLPDLCSAGGASLLCVWICHLSLTRLYYLWIWRSYMYSCSASVSNAKNIFFANYFILTFCNFLNNDMSSKSMTAICHLYPTIYAGVILSFLQCNAYITLLNVYTRSILGPFWPTHHAIDVVFINLPCTL